VTRQSWTVNGEPVVIAIHHRLLSTRYSPVLPIAFQTSAFVCGAADA
jgi:hypothetical protein